MSRNINRTMMPPRMQNVDEIPAEQKYRPWLPSPEKLIHLAGDFVNQLPMPACWDWEIKDVVKWLITEMNLAQYKDCFISNFINGRRLVCIDASACSAIGIHDLSHIKHITAGIRRLFHIEAEECDRSISLPPRYPLTHYLFFRSPTGPIRENTTRIQLFRMMGILDEDEPCPFGHWEMLKATKPYYPANRFGLIKRKNVYVRNEPRLQPRGHSYLRRSNIKDNYFLRIDIK